jgi:pimeloyl-ACP methyl ester carboxylesterase
MPAKVAEVGGTCLHYIEEGRGEPVLLLHGVNSGAEGWAETVRRLAPHFRVVAPDLPGWGDTPPPPGFGYQMGDLTRFLLAAMDALDLPRATVVGWSFGGCAALHLAADAPERVDRLALVAPGGLDPSVHWSYRALALPGVGEWMLRPTRANILAGLKAITHDVAAIPGEFVEYQTRVAQNPWFRQTTLRWVRRCRVFWEGAKRICAGGRLEAIRCPTLVLWGEEDGLVPARQASIACRIPGARLHMLPESGHIPHLEQPDLFHSLLLEFLASAPAEEPLVP